VLFTEDHVIDLATERAAGTIPPMNDARTAIERHLETITGRDLDGYTATLHDDVVVILPTGTTLVGKAAVTDFHRDFFADPDWIQDLTERTTTVGEHIARALYEAEYRDVDPNGDPIQTRFLVAFVFTRVGAEWLLLHDQCTPV
jgi:ketosteroid isomerase-like protein